MIYDNLLDGITARVERARDIIHEQDTATAALDELIISLDLLQDDIDTYIINLSNGDPAEKDIDFMK